jgi:DNA polymerase-3 subunit gamma/tau
VAPDLAALLTRLHRLEEQMAAGVAVVDVAAPPAGPGAAPGRAVLGGRARVAEEPAPAASAAPAAPTESAATAPEPAAAPEGVPDSTLTAEQWEQTVRPGLRGMARAVYAPATLLTSGADTVTFSLPNIVHREKCEQHRVAVEGAIRTATGRDVEVLLLVEGDDVAVPAPASSSAPPSAPAPTVDASSGGASHAPDVAAPISGAVEPADSPIVPPVNPPVDAPIEDDDVDLDDLVDVPPESVKSPIDRLAEAFPGSELIDERS